MDAIKELEREQLRTDVPEIAVGDTVRVSVKVVESSGCAVIEASAPLDPVPRRTK